MIKDAPSLIGITQGRDIPSTRFRWSQYLDTLKEFGFDIAEATSSFGAYAPESNILRPAWLAANVTESLLRMLKSNRYDLRFLQRNMTATLCTWEPLFRKPFVFDVDDAIFLGPRGASAGRIAQAASLTICGNNFLAEHFSHHGKVVVLPTAVDTMHFVQCPMQSSNRPLIGWSGSSSGLKYLYDIEPAIKVILHKHPEAVFKVVSDKAPKFETLPVDQVMFERWSADREVAVLQEFTVGLMPLEDDLWARGKCSFKMLTYMAMGLPVVVSPVGMNVEILRRGPCGIAAKTMDDWVDAISTLLLDCALAKKMGQTGRRIVETHYARNVIAPKLAQLLKKQL